MSAPTTAGNRPAIGASFVRSAAVCAALHVLDAMPHLRCAVAELERIDGAQNDALDVGHVLGQLDTTVNALVGVERLPLLKHEGDEAKMRELDRSLKEGSAAAMNSYCFRRHHRGLRRPSVAGTRFALARAIKDLRRVYRAGPPELAGVLYLLRETARGTPRVNTLAGPERPPTAAQLASLPPGIMREVMELPAPGRPLKGGPRR